MLYRPNGEMPHLSEEEYEAYVNKRREKALDDLLGDLDEFIAVAEENPRNVSNAGVNPIIANTSKLADASTGKSPTGAKPPMATAYPVAYSFPVRAISITCTEHTALMQALRDLTLKVTSLHEYFRYREELCALHLQINGHGLWAPGFRPWPKLPQKPRDKCADHEHAIQRDRLVIEAHWLHAQKEFVNVDTKRHKWAPLFDHAKPFDFDLAEQFAQQVWSNNHRVGEVLGLTPYQQCQMFSLRTICVKEHVESISKSTRGPDKRSVQSPQAVIRIALARWKERQPNLGNLDRLLARAQARYFLGEAAPAAQVAHLAGFISGTPPQDSKTVSESLKRLESWLPTGGFAALGRSL